MISAIAVDDDQDCLEAIQELVQQHSDVIELLDTCTNVQDAVTSIRHYKPNLLLLDVEIHDQTSFDLLDQLGNHDYHVVFVTAFDKYAAKAFLVHAIHYLTKPVKPALFKDALDRVIAQNAASKINSPQQLHAAAETFRNPSNRLQTISYNQLNETVVLQIEDLEHLRAAENYCRIILSDGSAKLASKPLKHFAGILETEGFLRIHKSHLVNGRFIEKRDKYSNEIILKSGTRLPVSRSRLPDVKKIVG